MSRRSRGREVALQSLFQLDVSAEPTPDSVRRASIRRFHRGRLRSTVLAEFADSLVDGVLANREAIDQAIDSRAEHWRLSRMAATDRTVLRIAAFELLHTDTPPAVIADEAIELARRYGGADSPRFVSGIIGRFVADMAANAT